mmetsp:Transcript_51895/g.121409  ORF Transcript_51895/g.121409 Transcript_51895/m.121409 type:complete len:604 (-) Transcript_51895:45-1856(-)
MWNRLLCCTGYGVQEPSREEPIRRRRQDIDLDSSWSVKLSPGGSLYDYAMLNLAVRRNASRDCKGMAAVASVTFMLLALMILQFTVMDKVAELTINALAQHRDKILGQSNFSDAGPDYAGDSLNSACHTMATSPYPFVTDVPDAAPENGIQCGLLMVDFLANVSSVDLNSDGVWSAEEAKELQGNWETDWGQSAPLDLIHHRLVRYLHEDQNVSNPALTEASIPLSLLEESLWIPKLCAGWLPSHCGNFEVRGILEQTIPDSAGMTSSERIAKCAETISQTCPFIFGPIYRYHHALRQELCGSYKSMWDSDRRVIYAHSDLYTAYVTGHAPSDGVASDYYALFLWLMIANWTLVMLVEFRSLADWWVVVMTMRLPAGEACCADPDGRPAIEAGVDGTGFHLNNISLGVKIYTIIVHLVPRSIVAVGLFHTGVKFLYITEDYQDLILNGVALSFLLDIDEMLFGAAVGPTDKALCEELEDQRIFSIGTRFSVVFQRFNRVRKFIPVEFIYSVVVMLSSAYFMRHAYDGTHGKLALAETVSCLCQMEGDSCVTAHILGSNHTVAAAQGTAVVIGQSTESASIFSPFIHLAIGITEVPGNFIQLFQ